MADALLSPLREGWAAVQDRLFFLPPFPDHFDVLATVSLLLILGLLAGEWLQARLRWPRMIGYVLAGAVLGPRLLGWISLETVAKMRPIADAALGILMLEMGRRLHFGWLLRNRRLLRVALGDIVVSFLAVFIFSYYIAGLSVAWAAAAAAVTMASAPAVVLLITDETKAQGQVTERIVLLTALSSAASFFVFALVLGVVHAQQNDDWLSAFVHPLWVGGGATLIAWLAASLALKVAALLAKRSLSQVFVLIASALLAVGVARMVAVPVFLTLFMMGVVLSWRDAQKVLSYTNLPDAHWLLSILLFGVVGAWLPWHDFSLWSGMLAFWLLLVRGLSKCLVVAGLARDLPFGKRWCVGLGIQPLSATAIFMAYELAALYPEVGRSALALPLFAATIMELAGPLLCRFALRSAGETAEETHSKGLG